MKIRQRAIVIPDQHFPFHSEVALNVVVKAMVMIKPQILVNLGDVGEWSSVSPWQYKGNRKRPPLEFVLPQVDKEIEEVNAGLDKIDEAAKKAGIKKKYLCTGNHDIWLDNFVERYPYLKDYSFNKACKLKDRKYIVYKYNQPLTIGKVTFLHGAYHTVYHAKRHLDAYGSSVIYGHTHDVQSHSLTKLGGTISAHALGCIKDMSADKNEWLRGRLHNWSHAFGIVDWFTNGDFKVEVVEIHNGKTSVWGKLIDGNA